MPNQRHGASVTSLMRRLLAGMSLAWMLAASAGLTGCAAPLQGGTAPMLRLTPSSLGREITVVQRLDVQAAGRTHSMEVALEVDEASVRMAVMQLGQTVARLEWDGRQLRQSLAPGWPAAVSAERVLSDLQLVWWPATALSAALPPGWRLEETAHGRVLRHEEHIVTVVREVTAGQIELTQRAEGYTVQVYSQGASPVFATP
jgi:hypothetical protein